MTPPRVVPPKELRPTASDFPVTIATELDAGAELDVLAVVLFATLVIGAEVDAGENFVAVLLPFFALVPNVIVTLVVTAVVLAIDALAEVVLDALLWLCTVPVPGASWCGDGKHWIGWRGRGIKGWKKLTSIAVAPAVAMLALSTQYPLCRPT
jgi:hypothetical protein